MTKEEIVEVKQLLKELQSAKEQATLLTVEVQKYKDLNSKLGQGLTRVLDENANASLLREKHSKELFAQAAASFKGGYQQALKDNKI